MKSLFHFISFCCIITTCCAQEKPYSIVINEIMADPSPIVALPNCEFIELRNCSSGNINLNKWKLINGNTKSSITIDYILQPDSLVILCAKTNEVFFKTPSNTIGLTSFPVLGNDEDIITLADKTGKTIHSVSYKKSWHENPVKSDGGWSLEMINPFTPCNSNNWQSSKDNIGGSPGKENSLFKKETSEVKLEAIQCITTNGKNFQVMFNKGADSISLANPNNYSWESIEKHPIKAIPIAPIFNKVELQFIDEIDKENILKLAIKNIKKCTTDFNESTSVSTGIPIIPKKGELIINELLFNPTAYGADFLEMYNHSKSVINAKEIFIAGKNSAGQIGNHYRCAEEDLNILPGEYFVVTTDRSYTMKNWKTTSIKNLSEINYMPSYPDNEGCAMLINKQGITIDEFPYSDNMHHPFLIDKEGVSLERIDPNLSSWMKENWHSASSTAGYATPTRKNSQYRQVDSSKKMIDISQGYFSPNNDGMNDFLTISYNMPNPGNSITIYAFNFNGMMIRKIADNQLCGTTGTFIWDGLDQDKIKSSSGIYFIFAEILDLRGKLMKFKKVVALE